MLHCSCFVTFDALSQPAAFLRVYEKLPSTLIFPWKQVEAITSNLTTWTISCSALTQSLLFLWISAVGFFAREQTGTGSLQHPSPFWQRHAEMLQVHPFPPQRAFLHSEFDITDDSAAALYPPERGPCQEYYSPSKLSSNINPSTFMEEAHKSPKSCYSIATVTF